MNSTYYHVTGPPGIIENEQTLKADNATEAAKAYCKVIYGYDPVSIDVRKDLLQGAAVVRCTMGSDADDYILVVVEGPLAR